MTAHDYAQMPTPTSLGEYCDAFDRLIKHVFQSLG